MQQISSLTCFNSLVHQQGQSTTYNLSKITVTKFTIIKLKNALLIIMTLMISS